MIGNINQNQVFRIRFKITFILQIENLDSAKIFRTNPRGWYTFVHTNFALLFFFGHLWHASRVLFREVFAGIGAEVLEKIEFGVY